MLSLKYKSSRELFTDTGYRTRGQAGVGNNIYVLQQVSYYFHRYQILVYASRRRGQ